ncbi:MAG: hypothetical protein MUF51_06980 [Vicinamibacteria bacterium]|jgi:Skp family chaperone for outer membrane proteins|nr:hypothetical protein [Vicinamibacteria bacterium]
MKKGWLVFGAAGCAAAMAAAEGDVLSQIDVTASEARSALVLAVGLGTVPYGLGTAAFKEAPDAVKVTIVTGLIAWAKSYTTTPAFASAYAAFRESQRPSAQADKGSADAQAQGMLQEMQQGIDEMKKAMAELPPEMRKEALKAIQEMEAKQKDLRNSPEFVQNVRQQVAADRQQQADDLRVALANFEADFPANPKTLIAKRLRTFLDISATVDFTARMRSGDRIFADPRHESQSKEWKACYRAGQPVVTAARSAAQAWLAELQR